MQPDSLASHVKVISYHLFYMNMWNCPNTDTPEEADLDQWNALGLIFTPPALINIWMTSNILFPLPLSPGSAFVSACSFIIYGLW